MTRLRALVTSLFARHDWKGLVEYALILALIAAVEIVALFNLFAPQVSTVLSTVGKSV